MYVIVHFLHIQLNFSGESLKQIEQPALNPQPCVAAVTLSDSKEFAKNPKSLLNEFCQSIKFSLPQYNSRMSENGFLVITVTITIEGKEVDYFYTSEQGMSPTKNYIKRCEERAAEIAFTSLTELYGTGVSKTPP